MIRAIGLSTCVAALALPAAHRGPGSLERVQDPAAVETAMAGARSVQVESLLVAAQRAARDWATHDFEDLVARSGGILLSLPGSAPSAPLQPAQAALLLHAFADGAEELSVEVVVARNVDRNRAYVEARRTFTPRGGTVRHTHTVYFGLRLDGVSYRLAEIRVVP